MTLGGMLHRVTVSPVGLLPLCLMSSISDLSSLSSLLSFLSFLSVSSLLSLMPPLPLFHVTSVISSLLSPVSPRSSLFPSLTFTAVGCPVPSSYPLVPARVCLCRLSPLSAAAPSLSVPLPLCMSFPPLRLTCAHDAHLLPIATVAEAGQGCIVQCCSPAALRRRSCKVRPTWSIIIPYAMLRHIQARLYNAALTTKTIYQPSLVFG